jgi:hypothetical protein
MGNSIPKINSGVRLIRQGVVKEFVGRDRLQQRLFESAKKYLTSGIHRAYKQAV